MSTFTPPQSHAARTSREIGTLHKSEEWWRDQYLDLNLHGYDLRPRYHPDWKPSWRGSGKDFFSVEDGQPSIVSAVFSMLLVLTYCISYVLQWMLHGGAMAGRSCSRSYSLRKGLTS